MSPGQLVFLGPSRPRDWVVMRRPLIDIVMIFLSLNRPKSLKNTERKKDTDRDRRSCSSQLACHAVGPGSVLRRRISTSLLGLETNDERFLHQMQATIWQFIPSRLKNGISIFGERWCCLQDSNCECIQERGGPLEF